MCIDVLLDYSKIQDPRLQTQSPLKSNPIRTIPIYHITRLSDPAYGISLLKSTIKLIPLNLKTSLDFMSSAFFVLFN